MLLASSKGKLNQLKPPEWDNSYCINVVMASKGYPESYKKNTIINGLNKIMINNMEIIKIIGLLFHYVMNNFYAIFLIRCLIETLH